MTMPEFEASKTNVSPLFWIEAAGRDFPCPVVAMTDHNVYARIPGQANLAVLPKSLRGKTWEAVETVC